MDEQDLEKDVEDVLMDEQDEQDLEEQDLEDVLVDEQGLASSSTSNNNNHNNS